MMFVDLAGEIVVVTVMPDAGAIPSVKVMVIAVLISTTCVVTSMDLVKVDIVVVITVPTDVGVMLTVSTMEIAVVISIWSVDLVTTNVVVTVVPDVGATLFVLPTVIAVSTTISC